MVSAEFRGKGIQRILTPQPSLLDVLASNTLPEFDEVRELAKLFLRLPVGRVGAHLLGEWDEPAGARVAIAFQVIGTRHALIGDRPTI